MCDHSRETTKSDRPLFACLGDRPTGLATLHAPVCDRRPLRGWKWIGLSVEIEVGVTRGLMEYV
ncbi:hypothetical protein QUB70_03595 [Microcoleus sp. A003_D6]|uniref:hypothetical protein n=1 Tax=Microcoleus sp. A003_D6 TaxID=3055266 RepID=UPI002FCF5EA4